MSVSPPGSAGPAGWLMRQPYLILTLAALFAGGNVVAGKLAVGHVDPATLMILRWGGALPALVPFAIAPLRRDWPTIRSHWLLYLFYGTVGFASFTVLVYIASYMTSGVNIALEQVAINILVMLLNFALFRTRVRGLQFVGVLLTILGVAVTATHGDLSRILALDINLGDGLILIACLAYAIYAVTLRYRPKTELVSFLTAAFSGAFIASLVYQLVASGGPSVFLARLPDVTLQGWLVAAYAAVLPSIVTQLFYARGFDLIGSNRASLFVNLTPLFGALGSVLLLGERLELAHLVAAALIAAGIVLAEWSARR